MANQQEARQGALPGADSWEALDCEIVNCRACPRLVEWREKVAREKRKAYRDWTYWGRPVPGFGDRKARFVIVGLAPGAHGSNRTGRMFTGDSSGITLFAALHRVGFANQPQAVTLGDGLEMRDTFITAVARCAPPDNRPSAAELAACRHFLIREWLLLTEARVLLALGKVAFDSCVRLLRDQGIDVPSLKFGHGLHHTITRDSNTPGKLEHIIASYHPSRQNTQTGRLTEAMFASVFDLARRLVDET